VIVPKSQLIWCINEWFVLMPNFEWEYYILGMYNWSDFKYLT